MKISSARLDRLGMEAQAQAEEDAVPGGVDAAGGIKVKRPSPLLAQPQERVHLAPPCWRASQARLCICLVEFWVTDFKKVTSSNLCLRNSCTSLSQTGLDKAWENCMSILLEFCEMQGSVEGCAPGHGWPEWWR